MRVTIDMDHEEYGNTELLFRVICDATWNTIKESTNLLDHFESCRVNMDLSCDAANKSGFLSFVAMFCHMTDISDYEWLHSFKTCKIHCNTHQNKDLGKNLDNMKSFMKFVSDVPSPARQYAVAFNDFVDHPPVQTWAHVVKMAEKQKKIHLSQ